MLKHEVEIAVQNVSAEQIWSWMTTMTNEKYRQWHPDHRNYKLVRPAAGLVGMRFQFDEILEGKVRIKLGLEIINADAPNKVVFKALLPFPVILEIGLESTTWGTEVSHNVKIGGSSWYHKAIEFAIVPMIFTQQRQSVLRRHAVEEFKNLETLV